MSMTSPGPTAFPEIEVPAPRQVIGNPTAIPARATRISSALSRGRATTVGTTR